MKKTRREIEAQIMGIVADAMCSLDRVEGIDYHYSLHRELNLYLPPELSNTPYQMDKLLKADERQYDPWEAYYFGYDNFDGDSPETDYLLLVQRKPAHQRLERRIYRLYEIIADGLGPQLHGLLDEFIQSHYDSVTVVKHDILLFVVQGIDDGQTDVTTSMAPFMPTIAFKSTRKARIDIEDYFAVRAKQILLTQAQSKKIAHENK